LNILNLPLSTTLRKSQFVKDFYKIATSKSISHQNSIASKPISNISYQFCYIAWPHAVSANLLFPLGTTYAAQAFNCKFHEQSVTKRVIKASFLRTLFFLATQQHERMRTRYGNKVQSICAALSKREREREESKSVWHSGARQLDLKAARCRQAQGGREPQRA
jgi:hypothetical protein